MMKIKMKAILMAVALCVLGIGGPSFASQKLEQINAKVEQQSVEMDQKHGVLLDFNERNDLKLDLIAQQALSDAASEESKPIKDIAANAFVTYEITDLTEQRKLLIKIESQVAAQKSTGTSGNLPDYP